MKAEKADREGPLMERVLFKLVRKHLAGANMAMALERAKEINAKGFPVSISFLSDIAHDKSKAKYVTSTYLELIRQIARLHLRASVQVYLPQVGSELFEEVALGNLAEIVRTSNKYGVFVWFETDGEGMEIASKMAEERGCGIATDMQSAKRYIRKHKNAKALKIIYDPEQDAEAVDMRADMALLASNVKNAVVSCQHEATMGKLLKHGSAYRKALIFEFQLGYNAKKLSEMAKKGTRVSVFMPFGKDWIRYAMKNVPEGYTRFLASRLLSEEHGDEDGEEEQD